MRAQVKQLCTKVTGTMGNKLNRSKSKSSKTENGLIKYPNIPIPEPCDPITHKEWISKIENEQNKYKAKLNEKNNHDQMTDYELFVDYLAFNKSVIGYSEICIAARIIRYYTGCVSGVSIFNEKIFRFSGVRISIAIHPITSQIFIADEQCIYQYHEQNVSKKQFEAIAKLSNKHNKMKKITDLAFSSDGQRLLCLLDHNLSKVHCIVTNDEKMSISDRVIYWKEYDQMDCLKYDFNHFYLCPKYILGLLKNNDRAYQDIEHLVQEHSTLYTLDLYRKHLWIICNSTSTYHTLYGRNDNQESLCMVNQPILFRIPFEFVYLSRQVDKLYNQMQKLYVITSNKNDPDERKEYEQNCDSLMDEIKALELEKTKIQNRIELIDLYLLFGLKSIHKRANLNRRNEVHAAITVTAFDVDKFHGGVYIITSDKRFFRIEKGKKQNVQHRKFKIIVEDEVGIKSKFEQRMSQIIEDEKDIMNDIVGDVAIKDCWFEKANVKYPNTFVNGQDAWNITHEAKLRDVLPDGVPLGICNVRYDSVTGRIIVADNYKIQALYF